MSRISSHTRSRISRLAGAGMTAGIGCILAAWPLGDGWVRGSYDRLFQFRSVIDVSREPVVIVEMDNESQDKLGEPSVQAWSRERHAELLRILNTRQVDTVVVDIIFRNPGPELSAADQELIRAAAEHGKVVFAAYQEPIKLPDGRVGGLKTVRPFGGAINVEQEGLALQSFAPDRRIRTDIPSLSIGPVALPSLPWRVAKLTMAKPPRDSLATRWVNYYGTSGIPRVSYWRVISNSLPASLNLTNKIVFVGANTMVGPTAGTGTDIISTPYGPMPGVEVNATVFLNLLRRDWLRRMPFGLENLLLGLVGLAVGYVLTGLRPMLAVGAGVVAAGAVFVSAILWVSYGQVWFPWLIVCAVQIPCAVGWSIVTFASGLKQKRELTEREMADRFTQIQPLASIADHTLLRVIGRGAYGEVWLARNVVGLYRAVKVVYRNAFDHPEPYEREFRGIEHYLPISLNHPGLLRVLHVGRNNAKGYFYSIMEPADDEVSGQQINPDTYQPRNLAGEISRKGQIPAADCVRIFAALADALEYLHQQQLIHRDIKPSNIIFVGGAPKLADIGLVTHVAEPGKAVTQLGTEGYIPPEGPGSPGADVYSLGKVLYEACMGRDREMFPELPTGWHERPDRGLLLELNKLIGKACMADPRLRYASAAQMQADLVRLQNFSSGTTSARVNPA